MKCACQWRGDKVISFCGAHVQAVRDAGFELGDSKRAARPQPKANEEALSKILLATEDFLNFYESDDFHEDNCTDQKYWLTETVMEAIYGKDVYDWINEQTD